MKTVLVVTHRRGFEADPVMDTLRSTDVPVFRFNGDDGEEVSRISFTIDAQCTEVRFACDGKEIDGSEVGVAWCQQLPPYLGQSSSSHENLQRENLLAAQIAAFDFLNVPWLNHPSRVLQASNKVLQLSYAKATGLKIPATLVSNTPDQIRDFSKRQRIVAKNLATPWVVSLAGTDAAYTRIVDPDWLLNDAELTYCPVIYQAYHVRRKDYRVVVVGDQAFAAYGEPTEKQREDIRCNSETGESFKPCELDADVLNRLRILMQNLSIKYCAADFMEDEKGDLYFLEVNTCGAWWWIDQLYDNAIRKVIANYLQEQLLVH